MTICVSSLFSQVVADISFNDIRQHVNSISNSLRTDSPPLVDDMSIIIEIDGSRWISIEKSSIQGLASDQSSLCREMSVVITEMIYKSINYNREQPIDYMSFTIICKSKNVQGVKFKTKDNLFVFNWQNLQS